MEISQILVRPKQNKYIIQYTDNVGRTGNIVVDVATSTEAAALIVDAKARVPTEEDRPDKSLVEQEITELEYRLTQLKRSIGAA